MLRYNRDYEEDFGSCIQLIMRMSGGKKITLKCSSCSKQNIFYECEVDESFKAYFVVELWKRTKKAMQCGECLGVCDYFEIFPQERGLEEQLDAERKRKQAEVETQRKLNEEREKRLKEQAAQEQREKDRRRREMEVDDELAKLKRNMRTGMP